MGVRFIFKGICFSGDSFLSLKLVSILSLLLLILLVGKFLNYSLQISVDSRLEEFIPVNLV